MSAQASGWVWSHSPLKGAALLCHAAIADSVNDQNANEFWMSIANLAKKARVERRTAGRAVDEMVECGLLELLEERPGGSNRYQFVMVGRENPGVQIDPGRENPDPGRTNPAPGSREPTNPREPKLTTSRASSENGGPTRTYQGTPRTPDMDAPVADPVTPEKIRELRNKIRPTREGTP